MKVTKNQLKQLISEEIKNVLSEDDGRYFVKGDPEDNYGYGDALGPAPRAQKAAQQKTPAPAVSTDKADMSVEERLDSIEEKLDQILAKL